MSTSSDHESEMPPPIINGVSSVTVWDGSHPDNAEQHIAVEGRAMATDQAWDIIGRLVPEWARLFLAKNAKYKRVGNDLGPRGVFPDINRKVGILLDRVWNGEESPGEPTREVVQDLIGHLFLMLHMMDEEEGERDMWSRPEPREGKREPANHCASGRCGECWKCLAIQAHHGDRMHGICSHGEPRGSCVYVPRVGSRPRPVKDNPQA